ncbi:MAG: hypothetical protein J5499_00905 [Lachnospiraceae bacterium]|nr:hypothetical protein [Lachnospiraceae bacterium]
MSTEGNKNVFVTLCLIVSLIVGSCFLTGCSSGTDTTAATPQDSVVTQEPKAEDSTSAPPSVSEGAEDEAIGDPGIIPDVTEPEQNTQPAQQEEAVTELPAEPGELEEPEEPELPDTTPPVFKEYRSHLVYIGDTVSYRSGVILTDDSGEEPVLTIDSSQVNLKEAGEYPLTYTATDAAGNSTTCEVTVVVREREEVTQEMLDARADEIIEKVLGDAPRDMEALETLFKWTKKNIHYVNYFEQNDDISAAWEGLVYERGDCYVYACASKELLTRAGFKNDMIRTARHYWNLVDLGEGWYHYDTCPRKDKPYFFMWGDNELMEYSKANGNSHDYDHTKWPDVVP